MPIVRCTEQKSQTLEEFYKSLIPEMAKTFADVGSPMLNVLTLINRVFKETVIYGLTSHATLILLNEDSSLSPWYVRISGLETITKGKRYEYFIEYQMTSEKWPWPNARIKGATDSLDELCTYLIIALTECKGWLSSDELKKLYSELDLNN